MFLQRFESQPLFTEPHSIIPTRVEHEVLAAALPGHVQSPVGPHAVVEHVAVAVVGQVRLGGNSIGLWNRPKVGPKNHPIVILKMILYKLLQKLYILTASKRVKKSPQKSPKSQIEKVTCINCFKSYTNRIKNVPENHPKNALKKSPKKFLSYWIASLPQGAPRLPARPTRPRRPQQRRGEQAGRHVEGGGGNAARLQHVLVVGHAWNWRGRN